MCGQSKVKPIINTPYWFHCNIGFVLHTCIKDVAPKGFFLERRSSRPNYMICCVFLCHFFMLLILHLFFIFSNLFNMLSKLTILASRKIFVPIPSFFLQATLLWSPQQLHDLVQIYLRCQATSNMPPSKTFLCVCKHKISSLKIKQSAMFHKYKFVLMNL